MQVPGVWQAEDAGGGEGERSQTFRAAYIFRLKVIDNNIHVIFDGLVDVAKLNLDDARSKILFFDLRHYLRVVNLLRESFFKDPIKYLSDRI